MLRYTVLLEWDPETEGYAVSVPALPGCVTHGPSVDIALARAKEAVAGFVDALAHHGEEVPIETVPPIVATVEVEAPTALAVPA